jgi:hypothetical protein
MSEREHDQREVTLPTVPDKPWSEMTKAERLSAATDLGLGIVREILQLGVDPDNPKLLKIVQETALSTISQQIRVDEAKLRAGPDDRFYDEMLRRFGNPKRANVLDNASATTRGEEKTIEEILSEVAAETLGE